MSDSIRTDVPKHHEVADLWKTILNRTELPERGAQLLDELLGFYQSVAFLASLQKRIQQFILPNCYSLCTQLRRHEDWNSDEVKTIIPKAIQLLQICRIALQIELLQSLMRTAVATPKILLGFTNAVQYILNKLSNFGGLHELKSCYGKMLVHEFRIKTIAESSVSEEPQTIFCAPEEVFSSTDLDEFKRSANLFVFGRKSALIHGLSFYTSLFELEAFRLFEMLINKTVAQENSTIQLKHTYVFTDMDLQRPESAFFSIRCQFTADGSAKFTTIVFTPGETVDNKKILEEWPNAVCPICLQNFDEGKESWLLLCRHSFHWQCIQEWCSKNPTDINCPVCRSRVWKGND